MKKFFAILLAAMMVMAMSVSAFADTPSGKITVTGTTEDKTYDAYKIFDLTYKTTGTGEEAKTTASYTIDSDWVAFFIGDNAPGKAYLLTAQPEGGSLNQLTYNSKTYFINITESNVAAFSQAALAFCADNTPAADATETAKGETTVFNGLGLGYYLVYPQGAADIAEGYASLCSLTSTVPEGEVVVKATYPTIEKTVDDASAEVGQKVTFTITGQVPDTTGYKAYTYEVKDTMTAGLTFQKDVAVKFGSTDIDVDELIDYSSDNSFTLTFDMVKYQDYKGEDITITYTAVVNDNAVVKETNNSATLKYSDNPATNTTTETTPEIVNVYSSKVVIDKYDGADTTKETKLEGAKFVLVKKTTVGDTTTESFYKYTAATTDVDAKVEWVSSVADATVEETDAKGAAVFAGLEDGTYYLRETASPSGYNLLDHDVEVAVDGSEDEIGVAVTSEIENTTGTILPSTGGVGTTMMIAFASFAAMATAVVLVTKKRMYNRG